jgi:hypothetical protein
MSHACREAGHRAHSVPCMGVFDREVHSCDQGNVIRFGDIGHNDLQSGQRCGEGVREVKMG